MRTIRVLIAEDEPPTGRFIKKIVDGMDGFLVKRVCGSGEEGLEYLEKEEADLLMTDIRMPGMSGLDLIRQAKRKNPDMLFIIISGYKMFEYAKEAISLEAADYILKPVDRAELEHTLTAVRRTFWKKSVRALRAEILLALRRNDEPLFRKLLEWEQASLLAVYYSGEPEEILEAAGEEEELLGFPYKDGALFISRKEGGYEKTIKKILLRKTRKTCVFLAAEQVEIREGFLGDLKKVYRKSLRCMAVPGQTATVRLKGLPKEKEAEKAGDEEPLRQLKLAVQSKDRKGIERAFARLFGRWESVPVSVYHIRGRLHELAEELRRSGYLENDGGMLGEVLDECVRMSDSLEEIRETAWGQVAALLDGAEGGTLVSRKNAEKLYEEICRLMEQNMEKNFSLLEICSLFHVSPPYVRKIFKQYTDKTYKEYQTERKLERAKELMKRNPELLVREIADRIGFEQLYFSTVFSRYTGMTPSQYKDRHREGEKDEADL